MYGFTFLYIFYWILRAVFPNIYLGSNIAVMHPHNIYPQIMMGLSSIWGYYYIFKNLDVIRRYKSFNFLFRIIFIYVVWGLYYYFENLNFTELTDIIKTISPFTLFFVFYIGLHKDGKKTMVCSIAIIIAMVVNHCYLFTVDNAYAQTFSGDHDMDSIHGSFFASMTAIPLLFNKKQVSLYLYSFFMLFAFYCGSRSGILASLFSLPVAYSQFKPFLRSKKVILIFIIGIIASTPKIISAYENLLSRMDKEQDSGSFGSGRSDFYPVIWEDYKEGTITQITFGRSADNMISNLEKKMGIAITAHNGWLDTIYQYGIIGICVYLSIFYSLIARRKYIRKYSPQYYRLYLYTIFYWVITNSVTHGILPVSFSMTWAFIIFNANSNKNQLCYEAETRNINSCSHKPRTNQYVIVRP